MAHVTLARFTAPTALHGHSLLAKLPLDVRVPLQVRELRCCVCSYSMAPGTFSTLWTLPARTARPIPRAIAHRGLLYGTTDAVNENVIGTLIHRSKQVDVELDLWCVPHPLLGELVWCIQHSPPSPLHIEQHASSGRSAVAKEWIVGHGAPGGWVHAKNRQAASMLAALPRVHWFAHDDDVFVTTSKGVPWAFPGEQISGGVWVTNAREDALVAELRQPPHPTTPWPAAVCTDWPIRILARCLSSG